MGQEALAGWYCWKLHDRRKDRVAMAREVFVLGTSHSLQRGARNCTAASIALLEEEVQRILTEYDIGRIAEEMSVDALEDGVEQKACRTVCQRIAGVDVPVVFVDLDREERAHLSLANDQIDAFVFKHSAEDGERTRIRDALSDLCGELRERVWVARVLAGDEWPVLIVCGADHAVSVTRLFRSVGVQSTIIHRDFDPDEYPWCR